MSDAAELVKVIKKAAVEAVNAQKPAAVCFGRVISVSPLKISLEQRLVLGEGQLILTDGVKDRFVDVEISCYTDKDGYEVNSTEGNAASDDNRNLNTVHRHEITGKKRALIHSGLREGEGVIMLRAEGGQRFIVLDRLNDEATEGEWI